MKLRVLVQGTTVLACATLAGTAFLSPAQAATPLANNPLAATFTSFPQTPAIPSSEDIANAKKSAAATAAASAKIDGLIASANTRLQAASLTSMSANNTYSDAVVALGQRQTEARAAKAKADIAAKQYSGTKAKLGSLAGNLYKTGGLNLDMQSFLTSSDANDTMYQASTLMTLTADQTRTYQQAQEAASSSTALQKQSAAAQNAASEAAKLAEQSKTAAQNATNAQAAILKENTDQQTILVGQLATLNNTTVALETARVDGLAQQAQAAALAAAIQESANAPKPVAPAAIVAESSASASNGGGTAASPVTPAQPPVVAPPVVASPVVAPPVVAPPVVAPPVVAPPAVKPPVVTNPTPPSQPTGSYTQVMVNFAMSRIGSPYWWGGTGPGYDCSGLVYMGFAAAGKSVPRTGTAQFWAAPVRVPLSQMRYGDLLVFDDNGTGNFGHIAIYIGNGQVVQALNPSTGVTVTPLAYMSGMSLYPYAARY